MMYPQDRMPDVVKWLLLANVAVFVAVFGMQAMGIGLGAEIHRWGALVPNAVWGQGQVWRIATYQFLHGGVFHLAFNMLTLWMFGVPLTWQMGEKRFLALYLSSGVMAGLGSALFYFVGGAGGAQIVGASGALFGVLLAYARYNGDTPMSVFFLFFLPARYAVWIFGIMAFLGGLEGGGTVAHLTHLFGLLGGWLYLRFESPVVELGGKVAAAREQAQTVKMVEELQSREEYFDTRVDPILKKISKHGANSLTLQEKAVLERASKMSKPSNTVDFRAWKRDR